MKIKFVRRKEIITKTIMSAVLLALLFLSFLFSDALEDKLGLNVTLRENQVSSAELVGSEYKVHYIDVGQGNSIFIELPDGKTMLIDGGNAMYGEKVASFLLECGVESLDYMVASHADADHIGGLNHVLEKFEVKHVFRPFQICGTGTNADNFEVFEFEDLSSVYHHYLQTEGTLNKISRVTSLTYKDFISNIYNEKFHDDSKFVECEVEVFYDGLTISGSNYKIEFFAPLLRDNSIDISKYTQKTSGFATKGYGVSDSNNNSAIILLSCFDEKFLFTGDASFEKSDDMSKFGTGEEFDFLNSLTEHEKELLSNVTVYMAGHHGSSTSSSEQLLKQIKPEFVVISVGDNNFGHPTAEVMSRIHGLNSLEPDYLLRTDVDGTICFSSLDGAIVYVVENDDDLLKHSISWELLSGLICLTLIFLIAFFKPNINSLTANRNKSIIKIGGL